MWNSEIEINFFNEALKSFASPEKLFYKLDDGYYAYIPKSKNSQNLTLQSRNSLIGQFTERWCKEMFEPVAKRFNLYAVNGVECEEIGLSKKSNADLAFCTTNDTKQSPENIKLIFEIKMSIVSNYFYKNNDIKLIGDYKSHKGQPSLLRSDSMLKAIGKAINIRVSGKNSNKIPIIVLGNSPISKNYLDKVDYLEKSGVVQVFWSLYSNPTTEDFIYKSKESGFHTLNSLDEIVSLIETLLNNELNYFSSMITKRDLGRFISISSKEKSEIKMAEKFLELINL